MTADSSVEAQLTETLAEIAAAIHEAECEAYTHEGRNARCERSARAALPVVAQHVEDARTDERERIRKESEQPVLGYIQRARWNEWKAVCEVKRCGWSHSQGNKTREDAEKHLRGHASMVHPPRIPVRARIARAEGEPT